MEVTETMGIQRRPLYLCQPLHNTDANLIIKTFYIYKTEVLKLFIMHALYHVE